MQNVSAHYRRSLRRGFTLIELLIVVSITVILLAMTVTAVNMAVNGDRVRGAARQVQSYLAGARDRAIYAKEVRGVRLLVDPSDPHAVNGMVYVGAPERLTEGTLSFDPTGQIVTNSNFSTLASEGLLAVGNAHRIQIPSGTGPWFRVVPGSNPNNDALRGTGSSLTLSEPCRPFAGQSGVTYTLELLPTQLPDTAPVTLPRGVVIDLNGSKVPAGWRPFTATEKYGSRRHMDILFTSRGTVTGDAAGEGLVHLLLCEVQDLERWNALTIPNRDRITPAYFRANLPVVVANDPTATALIVRGDQILVSLSARTGNVATYQVNPTNLLNNYSGPPLVGPPDLLADDPYKFAETGEVTGR